MPMPVETGKLGLCRPAVYGKVPDGTATASRATDGAIDIER